MTELPATTDSAEHLVAAVEFANAGISVVPATVGKRPLDNWKQYQSERASLEQIITWFGSGHTGLGIITGAISGNLEMVEAEGRAVAADLVSEAEEIAKSSGLGELWNRICDGYFEITPSGGYHWLYRCEEAISGNQKLAQRPGAESSGREVLFETRGEGGFVVVSPTSGNIHPDGGKWQRLSGTPKTIATITSAEREAFLSIFRALDQMPKHEPQEVRERYHNSDGSLSTGDDYNQRESWDNILIPQGWKKAHKKASGEQFWIRPGKEIGIGASTGRTEADNLFVFTTSTNFDPETPYSKFAAYTLLNFGNLTSTAFQQARKQLMAQGYGNTSTSATEPVSALNRFEPVLDSQLTVDPETGEILESSWQPADLAAYVSGTIITPMPGILLREDHVGLLYNGRVHSFYGESESGKSWVAQWAVAQVISQGKNAIYIDFEADASDIVSRLQLIGVPNHNIVNNLTYIKPETRARETDPFWQQLLTATSTELVVIDGVTESLTIWGAETKDNDSITTWMRQFPRRIAKATGAAVVTIDHVSKSSDTRGRFAIGGQAKLAALDGAAYLIEPLDALAPGKVGSVSIRVTKDRPGGVRRHSVNWRKSDRTQETAIFKMDSSDAGISVWVNVPLSDDQLAEVKFQKIDETIRQILGDGEELGVNEIVQRSQALEQGVAKPTLSLHLHNGAEAGWLRVRSGARGAKLYSLAERFGVEIGVEND